MNIATLIIVFIIAVSAKLALKHMYKNGLCVGCPDAKNCPGSCGKVEKQKNKKSQKKNSEAEEKEKLAEGIVEKHGLDTVDEESSEIESE